MGRENKETIAVFINLWIAIALTTLAVCSTWTLWLSINEVAVAKEERDMVIEKMAALLKVPEKTIITYCLEQEN